MNSSYLIILLLASVNVLYASPQVPQANVPGAKGGVPPKGPTAAGKAGQQPPAPPKAPIAGAKKVPPKTIPPPNKFDFPKKSADVKKGPQPQPVDPLAKKINDQKSKTPKQPEKGKISSPFGKKNAGLPSPSGTPTPSVGSKTATPPATPKSSSEALAKSATPSIGATNAFTDKSPFDKTSSSSTTSPTLSASKSDSNTLSSPSSISSSTTESPSTSTSDSSTTTSSPTSSESSSSTESPSTSSFESSTTSSTSTPSESSSSTESPSSSSSENPTSTSDTLSSTPSESPSSTSDLASSSTPGSTSTDSASKTTPEATSAGEGDEKPTDSVEPKCDGKEGDIPGMDDKMPSLDDKAPGCPGKDEMPGKGDEPGCGKGGMPDIGSKMPGGCGKKSGIPDIGSKMPGGCGKGGMPDIGKKVPGAWGKKGELPDVGKKLPGACGKKGKFPGIDRKLPGGCGKKYDILGGDVGSEKHTLPFDKDLFGGKKDLFDFTKCLGDGISNELPIGGKSCGAGDGALGNDKLLDLDKQKCHDEPRLEPTRIKTHTLHHHHHHHHIVNKSCNASELGPLFQFVNAGLSHRQSLRTLIEQVRSRMSCGKCSKKGCGCFKRRKRAMKTLSTAILMIARYLNIKTSPEDEKKNTLKWVRLFRHDKDAQCLLKKLKVRRDLYSKESTRAVSIEELRTILAKAEAVPEFRERNLNKRSVKGHKHESSSVSKHESSSLSRSVKSHAPSPSSASTTVASRLKGQSESRESLRKSLTAIITKLSTYVKFEEFKCDFFKNIRNK